MQPQFRGVGEGFRDALSRLDDRGCSLLVTGTAGPDAFAALCRRLNGDSGLDRRRALVSLDAGAASAESYLPDGVGVDDEHVELVDQSNHRFAAAVDVPDPATDEPGANEPPELAELEREIDAAIRSLEPATGYEPGMFRLVVNSVEPLIEAHGHDAVRRWIRVVSSEVTDLSVRGRAAFVAPSDPDDAHLEPFRDVFDARIEVKGNRSGALHRWVVSPDVLPERAEPLKTEWIAIPE